MNLQGGKSLKSFPNFSCAATATAVERETIPADVSEPFL